MYALQSRWAAARSGSASPACGERIMYQVVAFGWGDGRRSGSHRWSGVSVKGALCTATSLNGGDEQELK